MTVRKLPVLIRVKAISVRMPSMMECNPAIPITAMAGSRAMA
jgi:hypothetical protein